MKLLKALTTDPISAVAASWDATMTFGTALIPPTQNRIDRFKELFPLRYARMKEKILRKANKWLKSHPNHDLEAYCDFITDNEEDRLNLIKILTDKE